MHVTNLAGASLGLDNVTGTNHIWRQWVIVYIYKQNAVANNYTW
jgi:hypothetical protein